MLPEVRMARIIDAIGLHQAKKLSCVEAAELLGMSERHFRRLRDAYEERGAEGIVDWRRGRGSGRRAGVDEIAWVIEEFRTRYFDFTAKHFNEAIRGRPMADGRSGWKPCPLIEPRSSRAPRMLQVLMSISTCSMAQNRRSRAS